MCNTAVRTTSRYNIAVNFHLAAVEKRNAKLRGDGGIEMREELEIETRALVTKEIQSVDENEKLLYSVEEKENLVQLAKTVLKPKLVVSI